MNWKIIFNPFERFDAKLLFTISLISLIVCIAAGYWTDSFFSSIYRVNHREKVTYQNVAVPTVISFAVGITVIFILGKIVNNKTRLIDIINTILISQVFLVLLLPLQKIPYICEAGERIGQYQTHPAGAFPVLDSTIIIFITILNIIILIYSMIIYYNGFKTATNIKKWQHIVLFCTVSFLTVLICQLFNN